MAVAPQGSGRKVRPLFLFLQIFFPLNPPPGDFAPPVPPGSEGGVSLWGFASWNITNW